MSDFLAAEGIPALSGYRAEHITQDLDLVVVGNAISRGNAELEEVLDRKIRYCSLPEAIREHFLWGARSIVIAGTHGKTTTTALTGWVLTDGGVDPSVLVGGIARNFGERGLELSHRTGPRLRHRGRRVRQRVLRQDGEVPEVPARHRRHQQRRVRPRRHLRRPRRGDAGVPPAGQPRAPARAAAARRRQPGRRRAEGRAPSRGGDVRDSRRRRLAGARARRRPSGSTRFHVRRARRRRSATFEVPLVGAHNVRNALAAIAVATEVGVERRGDRRGPAHRLPASSAGSRSSATADGVTVYDDFAHHPTAVAETLAGSARVESERADLGGVRAAVGVVVPARVSGRLRAGVRRADEVVAGARSFRSTLPEAERLSVPELVRDLDARGQSAREARIDRRDRRRSSSDEHRPGDLVVVMSNGGFGGIHGRLLQALGCRK